MKGGQHHIELEPFAKPVCSGALRNVAEPQKEALKKELDDLVRQEIIEFVEGPSEWLHPIVIVPKKDGNIRMCVDLTKLNKYIKRPVNPQPTPWEVVRTVPKGKKHFAVFDALKGYHQIELDEESRALTTFLTPFGRFRYKRLPMGESDASDVFTLRYGLAVDVATDGRRTTEDTLWLETHFQSCLPTLRSSSRHVMQTTSHSTRRKYSGTEKRSCLEASWWAQMDTALTPAFHKPYQTFQSRQTSQICARSTDLQTSYAISQMKLPRFSHP